MRQKNFDALFNAIKEYKQCKRLAKPLSKVSKHLQKLSFRVLGSEFHIGDLSITDNLARKTLKYKLAKKMKTMKFEDHAFAYYAPCLRNNLQKLTLTRNKFKESTTRVDTKVLGSFKHLQKLTILDRVLWGYLKSARKLQNLQELSFMIEESNIPYVENLFRSLKKLHTVQVRILEDRESLQMNQKTIWRFLKSLADLKSLKSLRLFMKISSLKTAESSGMFYQLIGLLAIERIEVVLCMESYEESEPNETAKNMLSKIEGLQIYLLNYHSDSSTSIFERDGDINKKIKIFFSSTLNIGKVIAECPNTKNLMILDDSGDSVIPSEMKFCLPKLETLKVSISHKNAEKVLELLAYLSRGFAEEQGCQKLENFKMILNNSTNDILRELIKINSCFSLNTVQKYTMKTFDTLPFSRKRKNELIDPLSIELFSRYLESISRLTWLKKLSFSAQIEGPDWIKGIENCFASLSELIHLRLVLILDQESEEQQESYFVELPVEKLRRLETLRLVLSPGLKIKDMMGFFERISGPEELNYLDIDCEDKKVKNVGFALDRFPKCKGLQKGIRGFIESYEEKEIGEGEDVYDFSELIEEI